MQRWSSYSPARLLSANAHRLIRRYANDGGAANDDEVRAFFRRAFAAPPPACAPGYTHIAPNVDAVLGACGFRIAQQLLPYRLSQVTVLAERRLATRNVRKLVLEPGAFDSVDGDAIDPAAADVCRGDGDAAWDVCSRGGVVERGPGTSGPMRQVVETNFRIVHASGAAALASFLANQFHATGHARAPVADGDAVGVWDAASAARENLAPFPSGIETRPLVLPSSRGHAPTDAPTDATDAPTDDALTDNMRRQHVNAAKPIENGLRLFESCRARRYSSAMTVPSRGAS